jgi:hypothetical protein
MRFLAEMRAFSVWQPAGRESPKPLENNEKSRGVDSSASLLNRTLGNSEDLKGSPGATLFVTILSFEIRAKALKNKNLGEFETRSVGLAI